MNFSLYSLWSKFLSLFGINISITDKTNEQQAIEKFRDIEEVNFTNIVAEGVSNFVLTDSKINISGESDRAKRLNDALKRLVDNIDELLVIALGTGGILAVPYVYSDEIYFNAVEQENLVISKRNGDKIEEAAILAEQKVINNKIYSRFIMYSLTSGGLLIRNVAFRDTALIPLDSVDEWAKIEPSFFIQGVSKMPFGYLVSPKNSRHADDIKGVALTYGCDKTIKRLQKCLNDIEDEFVLTKGMIFADARYFDQNDKISSIFFKTKSGAQEALPPQPYNPQIREMSYYEHYSQQAKILEAEVGLSAGILTPLQSIGATATEIKFAMQETGATVDKVRSKVENFIRNYLDACEMLINYYGLSAQGEWDLEIDWSYWYLENSTEVFDQYIQALDRQIVAKSEVRRYIIDGETKDESEKAIEGIAENEPSLKQVLGVEA